MNNAWLGMGGNVGDVISTLSGALDRISQISSVHLVCVSSFYQTPPWGKIDQPPFINLCCKVRTGLDPEALLDVCLQIEVYFGRVRSEKWGPRTLDIDLLAYDGFDDYSSNTLKLPHPFVTQRPFVLEPLNEIEPDLVILGKPIKTWNSQCRDSGIEVLPTRYKQKLYSNSNIIDDE